MERDAARRLEELRRIRPMPRGGGPIGGDLGRLAAEVKRASRDAEKVEASLAALVPEDIRGLCEGARLRRGTVTITASDAPARFEIDRWLRAGGEARVIEHARAGVRRVRVE